MSSRDTKARKGHTIPADVATADQAEATSRWVRPTVAADYIGTTPGVLARWRHLNKGPSYVVPPGVRSVLYDLSELDRWLTAGRVETSDSAQGQTSGRAA